jgi:hypothetical protein
MKSDTGIHVKLTGPPPYVVIHPLIKIVTILKIIANRMTIKVGPTLHGLVVMNLGPSMRAVQLLYAEAAFMYILVRVLPFLVFTPVT